MSTPHDMTPALERLTMTAAAFREAPERLLSEGEAVAFVRSARDGVATLDAEHPSGAADVLDRLARDLPTLPAPGEGWSLHTLADLMTVATHDLTPSADAVPGEVIAGQVVDLSAERARRSGTDLEPTRHDVVPATRLDDEEGSHPVDGQVVFHPSRDKAVPWQHAPNRDVLPLWLRDPATAKAAASWATRHTAHVTAFHTVRVPLYWARLAGQTPRGAYRVARCITRWALDAEGAPVRHALAAAADRTTYDTSSAQTYVRLEEQRRTLVRGRVSIALGGLALAALVVWAIVAALPAWQLALGAASGAALLGVAGRDVSNPVLSRSTDTDAAPKLTSDLILTALGALGIAELNKGLRPGGDGVRFPSPITRDGAGWRADVDLPPGVTAGDVAERRDRLASGLRRPLSSVWPESNHDVHTGRLVLWVADRPMNKAKPVAWPLAGKGSVNLFQSFPIGVDPRGRTVTTELMFVSCIVGAMPRMGKTFGLRIAVLGAALDPRAELHIYDLKGGADWMPLEPVAHAFRIGDDEDDLAYLLADLRAMVTDMNRRYKTLRSLGRDVCPEGKVTDALASQKSLGLHPVVFVLDECQRAFEHPAHGKEMAALCEDLAKRGPAAAIVTMYATQRPDAASLPRPIASNAGWRLCFRVAGQPENDMVLGTSAYQSGTRATMFAGSDKGVGYLVGEGDEPVIVRMAYVDANGADRIAARAAAARLAAGRLTGHAAGADLAPDTDTASVLDHLAAVWPAGEDRVWCDTLAERLADTYPATYAGWTAENVTAGVKPHGLATRQIKRNGANRRGLDRADLNAALTERDSSAREADGDAEGAVRPGSTPSRR